MTTHTDTEALIAKARDIGNKRRKTWPPPREMAAFIRRLVDELEAERERHRRTVRLNNDLVDSKMSLGAERDRYRAAIEAVRKYIHSDKGIDLSEMAPGGIILGILDSTLDENGDE